LLVLLTNDGTSDHVVVGNVAVVSSMYVLST
jgi:hypothetical protein